MSYRSEIAEIARYFKAVVSRDNAIGDLIREAYDNQNIRELKQHINEKMHWLPDAGIPLRPEKEITVLLVKLRAIDIAKYRANTYAYIITRLELMPRTRYGLYISKDFGKLSVYKTDGFEERFTALSFLPPSYQLLFEFYVMPIHNAISVMNFVLNYNILKSIMKPEHFKYIEEAWRILFGDVE